MDRRAAKELLHVRDWLLRADEIVQRGKYVADDREQTWLTLSVDLPEWHTSLEPRIEQAQADLEA